MRSLLHVQLARNPFACLYKGVLDLYTLLIHTHFPIHLFRFIVFALQSK